VAALLHDTIEDIPSDRLDIPLVIAFWRAVFDRLTTWGKEVELKSRNRLALRYVPVSHLWQITSIGHSRWFLSVVYACGFGPLYGWTRGGNGRYI